MSEVVLKEVSKIYENDFKAVDRINLDIEDKEFIVLVGPSGCGKSTTLRMIAGLETISEGKLYIGDTMVNLVEPKDRDIAMVFQSYALYPHLSVRDNIAFALKMKGVSKEERYRKVNEVVKILQLESVLDKRPGTLSGGQRQRVALGRAMVRNPKVFLFDEPLSNLDAKLRVSMRAEIVALHRDLQTTFIYVTHDQTEAMTMGDRIAVMNHGVVEQFDTPGNLYYNPDNLFVAAFIGSPQMNFFEGTLAWEGEGYTLAFEGKTFSLPGSITDRLKERVKAKDVAVGIRSENISKSESLEIAHFTVKAEKIEQLGSDTYVYFHLNKSKTTSVARFNPPRFIERDQEVGLIFNLEQVSLFDKETGQNILEKRTVENF